MFFFSSSVYYRFTFLRAYAREIVFMHGHRFTFRCANIHTYFRIEDGTEREKRKTANETIQNEKNKNTLNKVSNHLRKNRLEQIRLGIRAQNEK